MEAHMHRLDRDALNSANPKAVAVATLQTLMGLEDHPAHVQVMASAAVFLSLAEHLGIPAQEAFAATKNLINDTEGKRTEFRALDAYMKGEIFHD
jgi:hypothetical protein